MRSTGDERFRPRRGESIARASRKNEAILVVEDAE
jgi:hypothetical protein